MITLRLVLVLLSLACLVAAGATESASAWTWPVGGPVLRAFELGADPYAGGQHRGVDIGAVPGEDVRAPAGGRIAFAGSVPGGGRTVTIETAQGLSVTLVHLGAYTVHRDDAVPEGAVVGHAGENTGGEWERAYLHLGVRRTSDPHGYLDPLTLLPTRGDVAPQPLPEPPGVEAAPAPAPVPSPVAAPAEPVPPPEPPAVEAPASVSAAGPAEPVPLTQPAAARAPEPVPTPVPVSAVPAQPAPTRPPTREAPARPVGSGSRAEPAAPAAEPVPVAGVLSSRTGARAAPAPPTPASERSGGLPAAAATAPPVPAATTPPERASETPMSPADSMPAPPTTVASPKEPAGQATPAVAAVAEVVVSVEPIGGTEPTPSVVVAPVAPSRSVAPLVRPGFRPASYAGPLLPRRIAGRVDGRRAHASVPLHPARATLAAVHSARPGARPWRRHSGMPVRMPWHVLLHGRMGSGSTPTASVRPLAGHPERPSWNVLLAALCGGAAGALAVASVALRRRPRTRAAIPTREPVPPALPGPATEQCPSWPARAPRRPECRRGQHADPLAELLRPPRRRPAPSSPFRGRSGRSLNRLHGRRKSVRLVST